MGSATLRQECCYADDDQMMSYLVTSMLHTLPSVLSAPHPPASPQPPWIQKQDQRFITHMANTQSQVFTWNLKLSFWQEIVDSPGCLIIVTCDKS